jgi:hypothetical protein
MVTAKTTATHMSIGCVRAHAAKVHQPFANYVASFREMTYGKLKLNCFSS